MSVPRLFFAAYPFPPRLTGGTMRVVKFIKYLPSGFDGEVHVITSADAEGPGDRALENETAGRCTVHRVEPVGDPRHWKRQLAAQGREASGPLSRAGWKLLALLYRPFYGLYTAVRGGVVFPDGKLYWSRAAIRHIESLQPVPGDVLLTTCPERSLLVAATGLKHRLPWLPWIVDFRDGWYASPFNFHTRNPLRVFLEGRMEKAVFEGADRVVCATDLIEEVYRSRYPWAAHKLTTIFNGFDPEDFDDLEPAELEDGLFHVVYTGYAGGKRTTYRLLAGISRLRELRPELWERICVHFVGGFRDDRSRWEAELPGRVRFRGQVSHREALRCTLAADLLVILLEEAEGGSTAYTGKLFEYIRAGVPILVSSPPSGATRLVEEEGLGFVTRPDDVDGIARCFVSALEGAGDSDLAAVCRAGLLSRFDRREGAARLAEIVTDLSARNPG